MMNRDHHGDDERARDDDHPCENHYRDYGPNEDACHDVYAKVLLFYHDDCDDRKVCHGHAGHDHHENLDHVSRRGDAIFLFLLILPYVPNDHHGLFHFDCARKRVHPKTVLVLLGHDQVLVQQRVDAGSESGGLSDRARPPSATKVPT